MAIKIALFVLPVVLAVVIYSIPAGADDIVNASNSVTFHERHERAPKSRTSSGSRTNQRITSTKRTTPIHRPADTRRKYHTKPANAKHTKRIKVSKKNRDQQPKKKKPLDPKEKEELDLSTLSDFSKEVTAAALETLESSSKCPSNINKAKVEEEVKKTMKKLWTLPGSCYRAIPKLAEDGVDDRRY